MRHVPGSAAIYRSGLALLISALTFWFSGQGLSAADQGKPPQPAQTPGPAAKEKPAAKPATATRPDIQPDAEAGKDW